MEFSRYNCYLEDYPYKGYTTIHNLFTKKTVCYLSELIRNPVRDDGIRNKLYDYGILVENAEKDIIKVEKYYKKRTENRHKLSIMLVLTGACNCRCIYCYEKGNYKLPFSFECANDIIKFVEQKFECDRIESFGMIYYGGEPLLRKDIITELSKLFHDIYGKKYYFSVITNGTLLDGMSIKQWVKYGLRTLKISLDGCKSSNDKRRRYINGKGTYNDIINNLTMIPQSVEIRINIVLDEYVFGIEELLDELEMRHINATFSISPREPWESTDQERADLVIKYAEILKKRGLFQYSKLAGTHGDICAAKELYHYVIDGNGIVYECNGEFKPIGHVRNNIVKKMYSYEEKCKKCKYLPLCYGDCPYYNVCQKDYFDYLTPRLLKIYLAYQNEHF